MYRYPVERHAIPVAHRVSFSVLIPDEHNATPLLIATSRGDTEIVKLLLFANCDTYLAGHVRGLLQGSLDMSDVTPFRCAVIQNNITLADLLVTCGYSIQDELYMLTDESGDLRVTDNREVWAAYRERAATPGSLEQLCRSHIRERLGRPLKSKVQTLPLPQVARDRLIMLSHILGQHT